MEDNQTQTPLGSLGKFNLINHLTQNIKIYHQSTLKGVGDDAAVLSHAKHKTVVTTDLMIEGVHFDMMYTPLKHLGYKAVAINLSDIAAMNAQPRQIVVSMAVSSKYSVEALEEIYEGIRLACNRYQVDLVGGDTSSSTSGLVISITAIGEVDNQKITYRKGAKTHDLICATGDFGSAYAGLLVLEREKATYKANPNFQPEISEYEYVLERYLKPEVRFQTLEKMAKEDIIPSSMIDVSNGLAGDILHICKSSGVGCEIYEDKIPIDYQTSKVCSEFNLLPTSAALNGGNDYELLFTINQEHYDKIKNIEEISIIGHITGTNETPYLVTPQNTTIELRAQGWNID